jgi:hypothetical protein
MRKHGFSFVAWLVAILATIPAHAAHVERVAGGGTKSANGMRAVEAQLNEPFALAFDRDGLMYIAEMVGGRILRVEEDGTIETLAGREEEGFAGDGGPAKDAVFKGMHHLVYLPEHALLVADTFNHRVRRLDLAAMIIEPFAGSAQKGFGGDGGPALAAEFGDTYCLALGPNNKALYVADLDNRRIRRIEMATGIVTTIAGNGERGVPEDGAIAVDAPLVDPRAVAVDSRGKVYILERGGHALRVVGPGGRIRTVAGTGEKGNSGDGGDARLATMNGPKHLCVDANDDVLIVDTENHVVRKFVAKTGKLVRVAGTGWQGNAGEGGDPLQLELNRPHGVAIGPGGAMFIADSSNHRILKIAP